MGKSITIFSSSFFPSVGGVETYNMRIAKGLLSRGHTVNVITSSRNGHLRNEVINGINVFRLPSIVLFSGRLSFLLPSRLFRTIKATIIEKSDLIITNTRFYLSSYQGQKIAKKNVINAIHIEHGSGHIPFSNIFVQTLANLYDHMAGKLLKKYVRYSFGVSKACSAWLEHFGISSHGELYNCVDELPLVYHGSLLDELGVQKEIVISSVGRITRDKGVFDLVESYRVISRQFSNTALVIAGDGPDLAELRQCAADIPSIFLAGTLSHEKIMKLLQESQVFVFPSRCNEGLPTTLLEASLQKCVIISTPQGGAKEIVINNETGYLYETGNIDQLVKILEAYIRGDLPNVNIISQNANKQVINKFIWDTTVDKIEDIIYSR
ncbi:MAG: glycosyltransferase family 4 protein [Clostridiales bacterium]|nr:glycosyltransferase family 4 protein [Clostridiales bacterium]